MEVLKQNQGEPLEVRDQILLILTVTEGILDSYEVAKTKESATNLLASLKESKELVTKAIKEARKVSDEEIAVIKKEMAKYA